MQAKSAIIMRVLINRFTKGSPDTALKFLPEEEIKQVASYNIASNDIKPIFAQPEDLISKIHYSWLQPLIEKLPKEAKPLALSSLPEEQALRLGHSLHVESASKPLSPMVKSYILNQLYKQIKGIDKILPFEYLPETQMTILGHSSKQDLVELIEFLGINDLSEEIRHIVDRKILKNVYTCLTPKEQQYLKICMHHKDKVATPSLGLDKWSGNCDKLKTVLQTRGLVRLGKALSGEHPDFMWHLIHALDTGRGQALLKYYSKSAVPGITSALAQQVSNLMNFLKKKSEP